MANPTADLLITNAKQLLTLHSAHPGPRSGKEMEDLGIIEDGGVAIKEGKIIAVGKTDKVFAQVEISESTGIIDASNKVVMPGFVDPHTHLVFAGSREDEFEMRIKGIPYKEIEKRGGGILSTVKATRAASKDELLELAQERLNRMLLWGTTTAEVKSGYGLSLDDELKILEVIRDLNEKHPINLVPTFLGAHEFPDEYQNNRKEYLRLIGEEMIPRVSEAKLAEFCDVFCEDGFFTVEESQKILEKGENLGLGAKVHADEFSSSGGSELAGRIKAISADHVIYPSESGLKLMKENKVIPVLLPGTTLTLRSEKYAPARRMISMNLPVALATDLNPGTCTIEAMPIVIGLACLKLEMTPAEAITAATINAACAIQREERVGSLERGKDADIIILSIPNYRYLPYHFGINYTEIVIKRGKIVVSNRSLKRGKKGSSKR